MIIITLSDILFWVILAITVIIAIVGSKDGDDK